MQQKIPDYRYGDEQLNVHSLWTITDKHGPGDRSAVWVQGCSLDCPGCINSHMQPNRAETLYSLERLVGLFREAVEFQSRPIEGITLMGGEPMQQSSVLAQLLYRVAQEMPQLNMLLFTGYRLEFLRRIGNPHVDQILELVDTVIDGRYEDQKRNPHSIAGSDNQVIHHLNQQRLAHRDFSRRGSAVSLEIDSGGTRLSQTAFVSTEF